MGLFGGMAAGLKSGLSKFSAVNPTSGVSWADKLGAIGGALNGDRSAFMGLRQMGDHRLKQNRLELGQKELDDFMASRMPQKPAGLFGGAAPRRMGPEMDMGLPGQGLASMAQNGPPQPYTPMSMQDALPALMRARSQGVDIGGYADLIQMGMPQQPKLFNTSDAIISIDPGTGAARTLYSDAPKERPAPAGYRWEGDRLVFIPGGPADPRTAGGLAGARRAPPRARVGAGGMKLPGGFVIDGGQ